MDDIGLEIISQLKANGRTTFEALEVFPMNFGLATTGGQIRDESH